MLEQGVERLLVMRLGEEIDDGLGDDFADALDIVDFRTRLGSAAGRRLGASRAMPRSVPKCRASRRALVSPTCRMPSAKMKRLSGMRRRASMAAKRLRTEVSP